MYTVEEKIKEVVEGLQEGKPLSDLLPKTETKKEPLPEEAETKFANFLNEIKETKKQTEIQKTDVALSQWLSNDAWKLVSELQVKHNARCELIDTTWYFYQNNEIVKTCDFVKNTPICWQMYSMFLNNLSI